MEEWKEYKATEYCMNVTDGTHDSPKRVEQGMYLITSKHIKDNRIDFGDAYKISLDDYNKIIKRSRVDQWDIIISMIGAYCGFCYIESSPNTDYAIKNVGLFKVGSELKSRWLYYYLTSPRGKQQLSLLRTGSSQPYIALNSLRNLSIPVPDEMTMQNIVNILKSLDDKIEVNRKINENLEQQAQALFKSWFVDFEPFKDGEFVESELGMIPKGWRVGTLEEIIREIESGARPKGGAEIDGVPSIGAEKIERFGVYDYTGEKYINNDYYAKMKRGHVKDGDVLLYKDGAYTGKSSMALDDFPYKECAVNEHVFLLRTVSSKYQFFLYYLISYPDIKKMIHTLASAKAAQPGLNQKELLGVKIIIPGEEFIKQFDDLVSSNMHLIANNAKESRRLAELRDTLLPKLMSGEIKVLHTDLINEMLDKGIR